MFEVGPDGPIPDAVISFVRLLLLSEDDWHKSRDKGKPPKAKLDAACGAVLSAALKARLSEYPTSIAVCRISLSPVVLEAKQLVYQDDEALIADATLPTRRRHAVIVRLGEKRILHSALSYLESRGSGSLNAGLKRKAGEIVAAASAKKSKR